jgi:hypothetical protein
VVRGIKSGGVDVVREEYKSMINSEEVEEATAMGIMLMLS